jgi:hypothetical protein
MATCSTGKNPDQVVPSGGGKFSRKKISMALYIAPTELTAFFAG